MSSMEEVPSIYLRDHQSGNDFAIEIPLDEDNLSNNLGDIAECLRLEFAPMEIWHRIGIELYRHGLDTECGSLLANALEDDLKNAEDWNTTVCTYSGSPENRINVLNAAAVQAINAITSIHNNYNTNTEEYKKGLRRAAQYYKLARSIAEKFDGTDKSYNMVLHFVAGLINIEKAKHKKEDISTIMLKTKHALIKTINLREMDQEFDDEMNNNYNNKLKREPNFIAILCVATLSYSTGDYEDALKNYTKLLRISLNGNNNDDDDDDDDDDDNNGYINNCNYLGFVHLGIAMSSLKLKEFDIARHAFERAKKIDKLRNDGNVGYIGIKSRIGLALVYLNQYSYLEKENEDIINNNNNNIKNKKKTSMKKALKEITDAMLYCPNNPQLLVLMANFIGFSCDGTKLLKMWAGTAYDFCQRITNLIQSEPDDLQILSGLDTKFLLRSNYNVHTSMNSYNNNGSSLNNTLSTCLHPLSQCQAEACYVIAKMYHVSGDYQESIKWYYKSVVLAPYFILSLFGLSQMYTHYDKLDHSKVCLERILKINLENNEQNNSLVLSHYAYVCRKLGDFEKAKEKLEKATQLNPQLVDLWIDLAEITEQTNPQYAFEKYMKAKEIMINNNDDNNKPIPFELFNNIIVLLYELKDYEKAKKLSQELISITSSGENINNIDIESGDEEIIPSHQIIIQYNYARVLDALCEYKKARKIYRQILVSCPSFIEAILCSALYLYRSGKYQDAIRKFEDAAKKAQQYQQIDIQLDAYLYIQRIYNQIGKRHDSESMLKKIDALKKNTNLNDIKHDEYSELVSANYLLTIGRNRHHQTYYKRLHDALRKFQQILVTNPNNVYAVHGMGVAAAEAMELGIAKSILSKLRDCFIASSIPCNADMMVNLGHVFSKYQQWDNALKCYEKAKKKLLQNEQGDIPLYIVRTLFAKKDFVSAKLKLHQILRYNPTQELYLYNLALIEEEYACDILRKDPKKRTLLEIENVMKMLENAKRLYIRLDANKKTAATIPHDKLKQHLDHICNELLQNAAKHLEFQKSEQQRKEKKRAAEKRKYERKVAKQQEEERKKIEIERLRKEKIKQKALKAKLRGQQITINNINPINSDNNNNNNINKKTVKSNNNKKRGRSQSINNNDIDQEPSNKRHKTNPMDQFDESYHNHNNHNNNNKFVDDEEEDIDIDIGMFDGEESEKKKDKKKKKKDKKHKRDKRDKTNKKEKKNKKNKGVHREIDNELWTLMEIKIEEIVRNADLNTLTNRQVKAKLAEYFPNINIKIYKALIKEKINAVAAQTQDVQNQ